jgi:HSP20 family protein
MNILRYDPFNIFSQLQNEYNQALSRNYRMNESSSATADWIPPVDIEEYANRFEIHIDVPGVDPDQIDISLENGVLSISGNREKLVVDENEVTKHRRERELGAFYRRFTLPDTADSDKVKANSNNGVLDITIPKAEKAHPRRIKVGE